MTSHFESGVWVMFRVVLWRARLPLLIFAVEMVAAFGLWLEERRER